MPFDYEGSGNVSNKLREKKRINPISKHNTTKHVLLYLRSQCRIFPELYTCRQRRKAT